MSAGNQIIANGFENFDWLEVGKGALAGGIAGGIFGGSQHVLSTKKNADGVSGISKAKARLDDALKPLSNVKKIAKSPFGGANLAKFVGNVASNYNNAYSAYIVAQGVHDIVRVAASASYFLLENLTSDLIGRLF